MAELNFSIKYQKQIAEAFKKGSITNAGAGHDYDFTGAKGITVYSMQTTPLSDYGRGSTRFGDVTDLGYVSQEMVCRKERSFTKHMERLDSADIAAGENAAGKFLRLEIDQEVNPELDEYRLGKWVEGAATLQQMGKEPTKTTIVGDIMDLKAKMMDNRVSTNGLTLYIANKFYVMLKQANEVDQIDGYNREAVEKGVVGMFDGMKVIPTPSSMLPVGVYFIIKAAGSTVDPVKLAQYDLIPKAVGYSGPVVQGLVYYDSFVLGAKNVGIGVAGANTAVLNAPTLSIGSHSVTASGLSGGKYYVTVDGSDPRYSVTREDLGGGKLLTPGQTARVIYEKAGCVSMESTKAYE